MKFGYIRVSTIDQNLDRQEQQLKEAGCERIFFEKITGVKRDRPELNRMLEFLRQGDTVVVTDLTRLSRSTKDLIEIAELISQKGVNLKSLKKAWLDTTTAHGKRFWCKDKMKTSKTHIFLTELYFMPQVQTIDG